MYGHRISFVLSGNDIASIFVIASESKSVTSVSEVIDLLNKYVGFIKLTSPPGTSGSYPVSFSFDAVGNLRAYINSFGDRFLYIAYINVSDPSHEVPSLATHVRIEDSMVQDAVVKLNSLYIFQVNYF